MQSVKKLCIKLLFPPKWVMLLLLPIAAIWLGWVFLTGQTAGAAAYGAYVLAAYTLTIWCAAIPKILRRAKQTQEKAMARLDADTSPRGEILRRYLSDKEFRVSSAIYRGMAINYLYTAFRVVTGIYFSSVWFISMAVYYLVLGSLRTGLIFSYRKAERLDDTARAACETACYRRTAWLLLLLNIPMGGMMLLMIKDSTAVAHYPGSVIYLSAAYSFYSIITSTVDLIRYRYTEGKILSCARVLNFVAAMMSILALQSALIAEFDAENLAFRQMMNTLTGTAIYGIVIVIAIAMIRRGAKKSK